MLNRYKESANEPSQLSVRRMRTSKSKSPSWGPSILVVFGYSSPLESHSSTPRGPTKIMLKQYVDRSPSFTLGHYTVSNLLQDVEQIDNNK